jgi:hypothetical protein
MVAEWGGVFHCSKRGSRTTTSSPEEERAE